VRVSGSVLFVVVLSLLSAGVCHGAIRDAHGGAVLSSNLGDLDVPNDRTLTRLPGASLTGDPDTPGTRLSRGSVLMMGDPDQPNGRSGALAGDPEGPGGRSPFALVLFCTLRAILLQVRACP
jgi:hypothetical protein